MQDYTYQVNTSGPGRSENDGGQNHRQDRPNRRMRVRWRLTPPSPL